MAAHQFDAIVVGGGHNGLVCAVHLARQGMAVALFEGADTVGGAIRTEEVTLPGFRHDLYAMNMSLFAGSPFHREYADDLAKHGLAFAPVADCFSSAFPDGRWLGVSTDLETTANRIAAFDEDDAKAWRDLVAAFPGDAPHFFALLGTPMRAGPLIKTVLKILKAKGGAWSMEALRLLLASPREFLDTHFNDPQVKATLAPWAMHLDFAPETSGGALFPYLEAMANQTFGMVLGKGGADTVPRALKSYLEALGGVVTTGTPVVGVERVAGRATGVVLDDGEVVRAREAVVASVTPSGLLNLIGTTGHTAVDNRLKAFRHGPGTMVIHVAVSDLPPWTAGEELSKFAYVHLAPDLGSMAAVYDQAITGRLPVEPVLVVGQPTAVDPSRAPDGKHILWIQVRALPAVIKGDAAGEIAPGAWDDVKEAYADRVMAIIERYAPGLSELVLARTVHSPADLERANPNLVGGDSLGGSHHLGQNFIFRPTFGMAGYRTPLRGLYMVGSSTWPGAGCGAGSGYMLAKLLARA
ncbi:MAG: NAD(P)/FAD-dependent oxidoreductase [Devosia sp.]